MAKKPTAKAISQFQALAQKSTPAPMQKPMMPMPAGMPPKTMPKKKATPKKMGMVKGAMPKGMMGGM